MGTQYSDLKSIVVLGATGKQGGSVARALVAQGGWRIRAISRDPGSPPARHLGRLGIEVVAASLDNQDALRDVFEGAHGVYSVQGTDRGADIETRRGIAVADAALEAGVKHFVYASVGGADRASGIAHFESKWRIESHVRKIGLAATIIRPTFFMDNLSDVPIRAVLLALMQSYLPSNKTLQMIAVDDIGRLVARVFADPSAFVGKAMELAGDELTREDIVATLRRHGWNAGLPFRVPRSILRLLPSDALEMFDWFARAGYRADIPALRALQPDLMTLERWLAVKESPGSDVGYD
jgi:uncharacterized protein YbjT (DUF2867 family)